MDEIIKKAHELGHLLQQNDIVKRFTELSEKLNQNEDAKKLLEDLFKASQDYEKKEREGVPIEGPEKRALADLQEKAKDNELIGEYLATQSYYFNILAQVNEAIANPKGDPPKKSDIILPGDDKGIILT
jgi:cell fate (sporulation/competence/biofilm development) regulator YlbF (YheA/YmcA/DUF963 family)